MADGALAFLEGFLRFAAQTAAAVHRSKMPLAAVGELIKENRIWRLNDNIIKRFKCYSAKIQNLVVYDRL